jgi:hypothetical protein
MPFIILLPSGKNLWQLFVIFFLTGVGFYFAGSSDVAEAEKYKDGPKAVDVAELNSASPTYDYVQLTGLTDGAYIYSYFAEGKDEAKVDKTKAIVLYYALHTPEQLELSLNNEQSQPAVLVRQYLPEDQVACIDSEAGCMTGGEMTLEGRLTKELPYKEDQEYFDKLAKTGLYTFDGNMLYLNADWKPKTMDEAASGKPFAIGWMVVSALLGAFTFYRSRRNKVATPTASNASSPTQEQL